MKKENIQSTAYPDKELSFNDWAAYINATLSAIVRR